MKGLRYTLAMLTLKHRVLGAAIIFCITAFFAVGLTHVELRTIFSDLFPKNHPFVQTYKDHPNFGNPLTITIMVKVKEGTIYNAETLAKVWDMTRDIDLTPAVDHDQILSITTEKARWAEATPYGIDFKPLMGGKPPETEEELQKFRLAVDRAPNVRTFLISEDETATLITATFIEFSLDYGETFKYIQQLIANASDERHEIYVAGQPMLTGWVYKYEVDMLKIFAITASALLLSLVVYMRNIPGVVTPLAVSIVAAVWGFGFVGWLGDPIEPLIMVVPLLLVARSFSHCVQFIERFYEIYYEIKDRRKAAELALGVMMAPGVLGILTDAAGLFLIMIAPIPVMERFAIFCGFWALILIPSNLFLTPILLSWFPAPKNVATLIGKSEKKTWHNQIIALLRVISTFSHGARARVTTVIVVILAVVGLYLTLQIKVGNPVEGSNLLKVASDYNTAVRAINDHFPGIMTLEVVFEGKSEGPKNRERIVRRAEPIGTMIQLQRYLESHDPPPSATLSFADYLPEANRLFSGGNPKWAPIDYNDAAVNAAVNALMIGSNPKSYSHVMGFSMENATVSLWYKDNKQETVDTALLHTRAALELIGIDKERFRIRLGTGAIALQQSVNDTVDTYQWAILGALNLVILLTCSFAYRSFVAGILLLIPVNFSNVLLLSVMVLMDIGLDVNSLPIASIGIGVGIDYGIYLLSRICEEFRDSEHHGQAIEAAVTTTGKAIFFTATIVLIGILPWYFMSELKFLAEMGLLLVMIMLINMVIALIVLPLLVYIFKPAFIEREHLIVSENIELSEIMEAQQEHSS
ncbi:MAG: MMPL family transporter [Gammaproteobacteria bacterium]|nr:MMPL family transporter [Gammaproteobacteria bacterium]